jgi:hypothetical protein
MLITDLTETERRVLVDHLRRTIDANRFPHSPRVRTLRAILEKLEPAPGEPSLALAKRRRQRR